MKRTVSMILALAMVLGLAAGAAAETFTTTYYTLELPDDWTGITEGMEDLGLEDAKTVAAFAAPDEVGLAVYSVVTDAAGLDNAETWNTGEEEMKAYAEQAAADLEADSTEFLGVVKAGEVSFILISATDEEGAFLYAETLTGGNTLMFFAYVVSEDGAQYPLTEEYTEEFRSILETFRPAA